MSQDSVNSPSPFDDSATQNGGQSNPTSTTTPADTEAAQPYRPNIDSNAPQASNNSSTAEIDELLRKLDELSKELEKKEGHQDSPELKTSMPSSAPTLSSAPSTSVSDESSNVSVADRQVNNQAAGSAHPQSTSNFDEGQSLAGKTSDQKKDDSETDEDFDLDKFLTDLEKKIEAGVGQNNNQPNASTPSVNSMEEINGEELDAFRKQRSPLNLEDHSQEAATAIAEPKTPTTLSSPVSPAALPVAEPAPALPANEENDFSNLLAGSEPSEKLTSSEENSIPDKAVMGRDEIIAAAVKAKNTDTTSEDLAAQNIFDLLNIQASDEEKENFLREIEELIFEDFIGKDVPLLLNSSELAELNKLQADNLSAGPEKKEKILEFLFNLLPNLENLLYDKAMKLKEEMVHERIKRLEQNAANPDLIARVKTAVSEKKWRQVTNLLNETETKEK